MAALWWELPGPRRFLERVVQDLRDGKNVVLCVPEHGPADIPNAVQRALGADGGWCWRQAPAALDQDQLPAQLLIERFVIDPSPGELWNANLLAQQDSFAGQVVCVPDMTAAAWPAWRDFMTSYAHACRSRPPYARGLCIIPLRGPLAVETITPDICLGVHVWRGCVDRLDMLLYAANITSGDGLTRVQRDAVLAAISHLALWDPHVAEILADESLDTVFSPAAVLRELAAQRGWNRLRSKTYTWQEGMSDVMDGPGEKVHSAILAMNSTNGELEGRVWSAQVGVIFPIVEEHRRRLIKQLRDRLRTPFVTRFGNVIDDVWELEIGHLAAQVKDYAIPMSKSDRQLLAQLVQIRNSLSHLQVVEADLLSL